MQAEDDPKHNIVDYGLLLAPQLYKLLKPHTDIINPIISLLSYIDLGRG